MSATMAAPGRVIDLDNVKNFRDLGGYAAIGGQHVAWGRAFRSDGLYRASDDDLAVMDALGIRTVLDLRTSAELDDFGRFAVEKYPVSFHHLPVMDKTWRVAGREGLEDPVEFLVGAFHDMLAEGGDRFAEALQLLALPGIPPVVFHCAAGKDRTGLLAALLLAALGVSDADIAEDFGLTRSAMQRMRDWAAVHHPELAGRFADAPSAFLAAEPEAMARLLRDLRAAHGSIERFLSTIGVGQAVVDDLRAAYLV